MLPGLAPGLADHRVALTPGLFEGGERFRGRVRVDGGVDRLQVFGDGAPVLVRHEAQRLADQVHDAGLHPGLREDRFDRLGEALEPVDAADQDVADAALLQLAQHGEPELGALRALEPEPEHVAFALEVDADRDVAGEVADGAAVSDLHDQRVEEEDRVNVLERSGLPLPDVVQDGVGDARDQVVANLDPVQLAQVRLDVAHRHAARVHRNDLLVEAVKAPLVLGHDLRFERAGAVARLLDSHRAVLGMHGLLAEAVAGVAGPTRRRLTALVAEMLRQLGVHRPLDQPLRQTLKQPVRAGDLLRRARAGEQLVDQLVRQLRWLERIVIRAGVDRRQSPIGELLRQIGLPFQPARRSEIPSGGHNSSQALPTQRIGQTPVLAA